MDRIVRVARLPEMRLAYMEAIVPAEEMALGGVTPAFSDLWERFNAWRLRSRPALGRIDIAAVGWASPPDAAGLVTYRTAVPVRSDYSANLPAQSLFFPGGAFAYCHADDPDEFAEAFSTVEAAIQDQSYRPISGGLEVYKYHFNLDQHPADCGYLVERLDGTDPLAARSSGPLPIARD